MKRIYKSLKLQNLLLLKVVLQVSKRDTNYTSESRPVGESLVKSGVI